jgi:hypothetical protein
MSKELQEELRRKEKEEEARREEEDRSKKEFENKTKNYPVDRDGMTYDPKERDPKYRDIIKKAEKEAEEKLKKELPGAEKRMGFCQHLWDEKKKILKEKYNIDWCTPAELNPFTMFD